MATLVTFNAIIGDAFWKRFIFKESGVAKDITNWKIKFILKERAADLDANALVTKEVTSHSDPTNGISYAELISEAQSVELSGAYYYKVSIDRGNGYVTIMYGLLTLNQA